MNLRDQKWLTAPLVIGALLLCAGCSEAPANPDESARTDEATTEASAIDWNAPIEDSNGSLPDGCRQLPPGVTYVSTIPTKEPPDAL